MNLVEHPELLDRLASSYALGTLRGGARRRFEALAREHIRVRLAARMWQERLGSITELQPATQPSANVWKRIENLVQAEPVAPADPTKTLSEPAALGPLRRAIALWRGVAWAGALATAAALTVGVVVNRDAREQGEALARAREQNAQLVAQLQATPQVQYVAVLADDKSAPSMLVTVDTQNQRLILKRLGAYQEGADRSLQLWALPTGGAPQSLGVLGADQVIRLTASEGSVTAVPALAISLEPKGGVPSERGPTGPVLFKGPLLKTTS